MYRENPQNVRVQEKTTPKLLDNTKKTHFSLIGVREKLEYNTDGIVNNFTEIIAENFPNMRKEFIMNVSEATRTPNHDYERSSPRYILICQIANKQTEF